MIALILLVLLGGCGVEGKDERDHEPRCGNESHGFRGGDCVTVLDGCDQFPANASHLMVIGSNYDGECLVTRIGSATHASCAADHLAMDSAGTCGDQEAIAKKDEYVMVLSVCMVLHVGLACLVCKCREGTNSNLTRGLLFWWSDFFAGLTWNLQAAMRLTTGINDPLKSFIVSLVCGLWFEELFYDLPLKFVKNDYGPWCWSCAVSFFGGFYLLMRAFSLRTGQTWSPLWATMPSFTA